jgi:hypothetical protein
MKITRMTIIIPPSNPSSGGTIKFPDITRKVGDRYIPAFYSGLLPFILPRDFSRDLITKPFILRMNSRPTR